MSIAYRQQHTLAIIPARGGSKRLPRKNIRTLAGKPLIWYPIRDAKACPHITEFYVSTDDVEIAVVARKLGAPIIDRPAELATDTASASAVVRHAVEYLNFNGNVVLLQPTAPLRTPADVMACLEEFLRYEPSILVTIGPQGSYTGSVYIFNTEKFRQSGWQWQKLLHNNPYVHLMSARHEMTNLNYPEDWQRAEELLAVSDETYGGYSSAEHLAKESSFADKIGTLMPYLHAESMLENLQEEDNELYIKLRDNPARIRLLAEMPVGARCLDVGCSDGLITLEIAQRHPQSEILGIDIRPEAVASAMRLREIMPLAVRNRVAFQTATAADLARDRQTFDSVYFTEVLEHIDHGEHERVLRELVALLRAEGSLIISVPNRFPSAAYEAERRARWSAPAHRAHFSRLSLEVLLHRYFDSVSFFTLPADKRSEDGVWLFARCERPRV